MDGQWVLLAKISDWLCGVFFAYEHGKELHADTVLTQRGAPGSYNQLNAAAATALGMALMAVTSLTSLDVT